MDSRLVATEESREEPNDKRDGNKDDGHPRQPHKAFDDESNDRQDYPENKQKY